jgi:hypothetical protein
MRDGQGVELGGGELRTTVDGLDGEKIPMRIDWIAEPVPGCNSACPLARIGRHTGLNSTDRVRDQTYGRYREP